MIEIFRPSIISYSLLSFLFFALLFPFFFVHVRSLQRRLLKGDSEGKKFQFTFRWLNVGRGIKLTSRSVLFVYSCCRNNYALNNWRILERGRHSCTSLRTSRMPVRSRWISGKTIVISFNVYEIFNYGSYTNGRTSWSNKSIFIASSDVFYVYCKHHFLPRLFNPL